MGRLGRYVLPPFYPPPLFKPSFRICGLCRREESRLTRRDVKNQSASQLPDWNKMSFTQYPRKPWEEILGPGVDAQARDLVAGLVRFESAERITAREVSFCLFCFVDASLVRVCWGFGDWGGEERESQESGSAGFRG